MVIAPARGPQDLEVLRTLFREYVLGLGENLDFQGFEQELATLPGKYAPPAGQMLLARMGDEAMGCVALRPLEGGDSEMKRLYVRPTARGLNLGRQLAEAICNAAREAGYQRICLDTLERLQAALALYRDMGFEEIAPYNDNRLPGVLFLALKL